MKTRSDYIAATMFAWSLSIGLNSVEAAVYQRRGCSYAYHQLRHDKSELQRDEKELELDVNFLRKALRHHASQERIARLRYLVRQDWNQIVLDRGQSKPCQEAQTPNLANRRFGQGVWPGVAGAWYNNLINVGLSGVIVSKSCAVKAGDISKNGAKEADKGLVD